MKEKIVKALTGKVFGFVAGLALAALAVLQEVLLGGAGFGAAVLGVCVALVFGALAEVFRYVMTGDGYEWRRVLPWFFGGVAGTAAVFFIAMLWA